jgi:hypothetical protein
MPSTGIPTRDVRILIKWLTKRTRGGLLAVDSDAVLLHLKYSLEVYSNAPSARANPQGFSPPEPYKKTRSRRIAFSIVWSLGGCHRLASQQGMSES